MPFSPTPEQSAIIDHIRDFPDQSLMVMAYAGCAKTSTIEMAAKGIDPRLSTVALAFNKKIAEELKERLPSHIDCLTMNALGHRAWATARGKRLQLDADKMYKLTKELLAGEALSPNDETFTVVLALAKRAKSAGLVPQGSPMRVTGLVPDDEESWAEIGFQLGLDVTASDITWARQVLVASIKAAFTTSIDFDDQIYMSVLFGGQFPQYHTSIADETQDLSPLNHRMLRKVTKVRSIAVGDPRQAIYAFRGADSNSMASLRDHFIYNTLDLTGTFRVSRQVVARQLSHAPGFHAMPNCKEGQVLRWPVAGKLDDPSKPNGDHAWSITDIPSEHSAVLCRNNAPLMKLAYTLIRARRPVKILGRDIGAALANQLWKIGGKKNLPVEAVYPLIETWSAKEVAKIGDSVSKLDTHYDRKECFLVLLDASGANDLAGAVESIKALFADEKGRTGLVLSSGHRAKGLEWNWVMHLDPFRCPSKQAQKAMERGNPGPMQQELNLKYVIETRTKDVLVLANLDDCAEVGGE